MAKLKIFRSPILPLCLAGVWILLILGTAPRAQAGPQKPPPPPAPQVTVPNVVGMTRIQARVQIVSAKLTYVESRQKEATGDKNKTATVASVSPAAGTQVAVHSQVTVVLYSYTPSQTSQQSSQKPPAEHLTTVPDVVGMKVAVARTALNRANLMMVVDATVHFTYDRSLAQTVMAMNPAAGAQLPLRSRVVLSVYTFNPKPPQPAGTQVTVPNVVGMKLVNGGAVLMDAGLKSMGTRPVQLTPDRNKVDTVASTNPAAGAQVPRGTNVVMTVYRLDSKRSTSHDATGAKVTVPSVVGLKSAQAMTVLSNVQLQGKPASDYQVTNNAGQDGLVASQTPAAGTEVDAHTMVIFTLYLAADKAGTNP
jgi:beta-lactam-binding protein with PASTA domain